MTVAGEEFEDAAAWLSSTPAAASLSNEAKLEVRSLGNQCSQIHFADLLILSRWFRQIYGLYKVVTVGPNP